MNITHIPILKEMKTIHIIALYASVFFCGMAHLAAQEDIPFSSDRFSIAGGFEANGNARDTLSVGVVLHTEYSFLPHVSIGLKGSYSVGFSKISAFPQSLHSIEASAFIKWSIRSNDKMVVPFLQPEAGTLISLDKTAKEDGEASETGTTGSSVISASTGLTVGVRINVTESFYIEPYGRVGYIYFWAGGILFGGTFSPNAAGYGEIYEEGYFDDGSNGGEYFEEYIGDEEDLYGLSEYAADEDSVQSLLERILELESYPDSNQDELDALNNLLDNLLSQMEG
ncbi:MAG: hypothetical protein Ta2A_26960 [Treponemataceae bacterium]|nr:MAG: hypothetical protein Ta2A_26960 [Treponemataceae bacterium]